HDLEMTLSQRAQAKGIDFKIQVAPEIKGEFVSDSVRIKQILMNVIGNAIKFTNQGQVEVKSELKNVESYKNGQPRRQVEVKFVVTDTGVGLSDEEARRLFKPFAQADLTTKKVFGGTGLGLVISKHIANLMNGDVKL